MKKIRAVGECSQTPNGNLGSECHTTHSSISSVVENVGLQGSNQTHNSFDEPLRFTLAHSMDGSFGNELRGCGANVRYLDDRLPSIIICQAVSSGETPALERVLPATRQWSIWRWAKYICPSTSAPGSISHQLAKWGSQIRAGFKNEMGRGVFVNTYKYLGSIAEWRIVEWEQAYAPLNVRQELYKMVEWLEANPRRRKKNYPRFITNWLNKSHAQVAVAQANARSYARVGDNSREAGLWVDGVKIV